MRNDYFRRGLLDAARERKPIGKFAITFTSKELDILELRKFTSHILNKLLWVEDAVQVIIDCMARGTGEIAPYFQASFPRDFAVEERQNQTKEERRTLLYRLRFLFKCMYKLRSEYKLFEQWRFSGLEFVMDSLCDKIRQAFGQIAFETFEKFYSRMKKLWKAVSPDLDSPEAVGQELTNLLEEVTIVFETLHRECLKRERGIDEANRKSTCIEEVRSNLIQVEQKLIECHDSLDIKIDDIANSIAKAAKTKSKGRRSVIVSRVDALCLQLWETAEDVQAIRDISNTKITYKRVFEFYIDKLKKLGIKSTAQFKKAVRNAQQRNLRKGVAR